MLDREVNGVEIGKVEYEGRPYILVVHPPNCRSQTHWHEEPHADGSVVTDGDGHLIKHHHHDASCDSQPLNATLYLEPDWPAESRHEHNFGQPGSFDRCVCGAERTLIPTLKTRDGAKLYGYFMEPDENHPEGWSWERWSRHE